jgi:hypothetical protein
MCVDPSEGCTWATSPCVAFAAYRFPGLGQPGDEPAHVTQDLTDGRVAHLYGLDLDDHRCPSAVPSEDVHATDLDFVLPFDQCESGLRRVEVPASESSMSRSSVNDPQRLDFVVVTTSEV